MMPAENCWSSQSMTKAPLEDAFPEGFPGGSFRAERERREQHADYLKVAVPALRL